MTTYSGALLLDPKSRPWLFILCIVAALLLGGSFITKEYKNKVAKWEVINSIQNKNSIGCEGECRPSGSEPLPKGIVAETSNLQMQPLWGSNIVNIKPTQQKNLLALAVGIRQKEIVDLIICKFPSSDFIVMLFHYDGVVDEWKSFAWSQDAIHVSAMNQTKWWFAKRFLHPDIVSEYSYIFLWDEDIGVENFNPKRYLSIIKAEGLEISQPALDPVKSPIHYPITARLSKSKVHRRAYKPKGSGRCDDHSTNPPCVGWVEMMAPVFSMSAWRCVWHMIQNDLIHGWGMDMLLGYCAQGDRTQKVGVVDTDYIVHLNIHTLGAMNGIQASGVNNTQLQSAREEHNANSGTVAATTSSEVDTRMEVRKRSFAEMQIFKERWKNAVKNDQCWVDPYGLSSKENIH